MPGWLQAWVDVNPSATWSTRSAGCCSAVRSAAHAGLDPRLGGRPAGGLRAAGRPGLPPAGLSRTRPSASADSRRLRRVVGRRRLEARRRPGGVEPRRRVLRAGTGQLRRGRVGRIRRRRAAAPPHPAGRRPPAAGPAPGSRSAADSPTTGDDRPVAGRSASRRPRAVPVRDVEIAGRCAGPARPRSCARSRRNVGVEHGGGSSVAGQVDQLRTPPRSPPRRPRRRRPRRSMAATRSACSRSPPANRASPASRSRFARAPVDVAGPQPQVRQPHEDEDGLGRAAAPSSRMHCWARSQSSRRADQVAVHGADLTARGQQRGHAPALARAPPTRAPRGRRRRA